MTGLLDIEELNHEIDVRIRALPSLNAENVRGLRRQLSKRMAGASARQVLDLALKLVENGGFEYRFVAYEMVSHHRPALQSLRARELEQLGRGLDSWAAVDTFACYLSGPAWREHQVPDSLIYRWARSPDRWWRRAALVSTVPLNNKARGGSGDAPRTLDICGRLVEDRDDMVVKALSWALRALAVRDPAVVHAFLTEHQEAVAARVRREVQNKLLTGLKNPK